MILPLDALADQLLHLQQGAGLILDHLSDGNAGPVRYHRGHEIRRHVHGHQLCIGLELVQLGLGLLQLVLQLLGGSLRGRLRCSLFGCSSRFDLGCRFDLGGLFGGLLGGGVISLCC